MGMLFCWSAITTVRKINNQTNYGDLSLKGWYYYRKDNKKEPQSRRDDIITMISPHRD